ncbi:MAG: hypothetical protein C0469_01425 [Cyanobacteria bacterium DS2.3.42]|nr:hypothetical protein [Cyanobacteria bacterium DS2.3.42]
MAGDKVCEIPQESGTTTSSHVADEAICNDVLPTKEDTTTGVIAGAAEFEFVLNTPDAGNQSLVDANEVRLMTPAADLAKAEEIKATLNPSVLDQIFTLGHAVDTNSLYVTLSGLRQEDFVRVAQTYESLDGTGKLLDDLRKVMPAIEFARLESKLMTTDAGTNFAGNLNVALVMAASGQSEEAGRQLRMTFSGMNSADVARAEADWNANFADRHGDLSLLDAIKQSNIPAIDKELTESLYMKGQDGATLAEVVGAARSVATNVAYGHTDAAYGLDVFQSLIGANAPVRDALSADANFGLIYNTAFGDLPMADSYLQHGTATVLDNVAPYQGWHPFSDVNGNIDDEIAFAQPEDRATFAKGQELVNTPDTELDSEQLQAKQYYQELNNSFVSIGGEDQAIIWSDKLIHGEGTMLSTLAQASIDGKLTDQVIKVAIEQMSEADWKRLHTEGGAESAYLSNLRNLVQRYSSSPEVAESLTGLLKQVADAPSHGEVEIARNDLMDVLIENEGPEGDPFKLADAIAHMSAEDVAKYMDPSDPSFKEEVDSIVFGTVWRTEQFHFGNEGGEQAMLYAQMMLKQVGETGKPPVEGPVETIVRKMMNGELDTENSEENQATAERLTAMMQIYADPKYAAMLDKMHADPYHQASLFDRTLMGTMQVLDPSVNDVALSEMLNGNGIPLGFGVLGDDAAPVGLTDYSGRYQMSKSENNQETYAHEYAFLGAEKQAVQDVINQQNGETLPVDYARIYDINDSSGRHGAGQPDTFRDTLAHLASLDEAGRNQFMADYEAKYKVAFGADFINQAISENNNEEYTQLLQRIQSQGFDIELEDMMRLAVLDGGESYRGFEDALARLSPEQIESLKSSYADKYDADMEADVIGLAGENYADTIALSTLLSSKDSDPIQDFLDRTYNFSQDGMVIDPTHDQVLTALQRNQALIQQYASLKEELPPEALQAVEDYFREALRNNLETKANVADLAQKALDAIVIAGTIATCWSGVTGAVGLSVVLGTAANRTNLMKYIEGGTLTTQEQIDLGFQSTIDIGGTLGVNLLANTARAAFTAYKGGTPIAEVMKASTETLAAAKAGQEVVEVPVTAIRASSEAVDATTVTGNLAENLDTTGNVINDLPTTNIVASEPPIQLAFEFGEDAVVAGTKAIPEPVVADTAALPAGVKRTVTVDGKLHYVMEDGTRIPVPANNNMIGPNLQTADNLGEPMFNRPADWKLPEAFTNGGPIINGPEAWKLPDAFANTRLAAVVDNTGAALANVSDNIATTAAKFGDDVATALPQVINTAADLATVLPKVAVATSNAVDIAENTLDFEPPVETPVVPTQPMPTEDLIALATVRRGEGPWQTAERILAAGGGTYGIDEVRALSKAIKAVYAADTNNPDIAGLKVNHTFITNDNFDDLLSAVSNDAVKAALMGLSSSVS